MVVGNLSINIFKLCQFKLWVALIICFITVKGTLFRMKSAEVFWYFCIQEKLLLCVAQKCFWSGN